jgi:exopolysaccharide production protein ExoY
MNRQLQNTQVAPAVPSGSPVRSPIVGVHRGCASLEAIAFSVEKHMSHTSSQTTSEGRSADDQAQVPRWKRALDLTCIILTLPLMLPVGLLIALLIKIVSKGPVLFQQERIGYRGQSFMCLKFRTMAVGADSLVHRTHLKGLIGSNSPMTKMDLQGDGRLIPFGLLLRSTGLDELPQVINVVRGEMSLVGPRPCMRYEFEQYRPWQKERFNALPGLTGLWQVSGKNRTTFDEMMNLDIRYTRSQSMGLDVKIILRTIPALIVQVQDTRRERKRSATTPVATGGRFPAEASSKQLTKSSTQERI